MIKILAANHTEHHQHLMQAQIDMAWESEGMRLDPAKVGPGVEAVLNDSSKGVYYVAEIDGEFAGCMLTTYEWSDWRNATCLWIHSVFVPEKFRKQGVFRSLYQFIQQKVLDDPSLTGLRLYVDKTNLRAQKVYDSLGMSNQHYELYEWLKE